MFPDWQKSAGMNSKFILLVSALHSCVLAFKSLISTCRHNVVTAFLPGKALWQTAGQQTDWLPVVLCGCEFDAAQLVKNALLLHGVWPSVLRGAPACDFLRACIAHEQMNWISVNWIASRLTSQAFIHPLCCCFRAFCVSEEVLFQAKAVGDVQSLLMYWWQRTITVHTANGMRCLGV